MPEIPALADLRSEFEFRFRASEMTMVAGQTGSQKSGWALWLAALMGVPTLYFSADSSSHTVSTRLAAAYTGDQSKMVSEALREGGEAYYQDVLGESPIRFCYDPDPTYETIEHEVDAWVEMYDSYPRLVVVDNLMDLVAEGESEHAANKDKLLLLKTLARTTEACIIVLHHMSEGTSDPRKPAPRKSVLGKVNQTPENVLSIALDYDKFMVSVVKHRSGPSDPSGERYVQMYVDPARNTFDLWANRPNRPGQQVEGWTPSAYGE